MVGGYFFEQGRPPASGKATQEFSGRGSHPRRTGPDFLADIDGLDRKCRALGIAALPLRLRALRERIADLPPHQRRVLADQLAPLEARAALWQRGALQSGRWEDL